MDSCDNDPKPIPTNDLSTTLESYRKKGGLIIALKKVHRQSINPESNSEMKKTEI